jgi:hypothetical protein
MRSGRVISMAARKSLATLLKMKNRSATFRDHCSRGRIHLVESSKIQQYREKMAEVLKKWPELHFMVSGPWPPYSFANIELEFKTQFGVS